MSFKFSIGVVTYLGRFEEYFKPLVRQLTFLFPENDINVFINGHYDSVKQAAYLRQVTRFLGNYTNIRYLTNFEHQALAKGWNWLAIMAQNEHVFILNDDISIRPMFRYQIENFSKVPEILLINGSWSHFIISKTTIRKIGWFDERFRGIGDEDGDYMCRLANNGVAIISKSVGGIFNHVAKQEDPGWRNFSKIINDKYTEFNRELFKKKWHHSMLDEVPENISFTLKYNNENYKVALKENFPEMPEYYPLEILNSDNKIAIKRAFDFIPKIISIMDFVMYLLRRFLVKLVR